MKHTIKIMIPFLMIAGLLTGCGSQVTTGSKAETTQATKTETTTAVSEQETQTETEQTPETTDAVTEAPEETTDETADSNILVVYYSAQEHTKGVAEIVADALHTELVSTTVENWDSYDTVLIGYPLWWREASWVVNDFVMDNDFSGKDVIPFCTSMSDGIGDSGVHLAEMAGTGNWLEGMRFSENYDTAEVTEWVDSLNLQ